MITLYTLHYNDPVFFGEGFSMVNVPETGWSSSFTFDENGKTITGEGFQFSFDYLNGSGRQEPVFFGSSNSYAVYEKKVYYTSEMPLRVGLEGFLSSPELMRDNALKQLDALSNSVREYLNSSSAVRCEYGPYLGHGIPPACNERALNASERQEQEKIARAYFLRQKSVVGGHYNELYGSLMEAFPFGKCWK